MKKELGLLVTLLTMGALAGCNNQQEPETSQ